MSQGEVETIDNRERGCGHLEHEKAYLRADLSREDGSLPPFVEFERPIPHLEIEKNIRGWENFPGIQFELAVPVNTFPEDEIYRHLNRLSNIESGEHVGEMDSAQAHDLLMGVGATHYPTPEDFIEECRHRGLNKAIPVSENKKPPVVLPGRTRVFLYHPRAITREPEEEDGDPRYYGGIIGYSYLTRVVWTEPEDDDMVPEYIKEYMQQGRMEMVRPGPERDSEEEPPEDQSSFDEFAAGK